METLASEALNLQTFMIVWDINFEIIKNVDRIDIVSPLFPLNESENTNWFRIYRFDDKISIDSNLLAIEAVKLCTTYMINPLKCKLLDNYNGLTVFTWSKHDWSDNMRFVFEVKMEYKASAVQGTIWKHLITKTRSALNTNGILLTLNAEKVTHTVVNNRGNSCVVKRAADGIGLSIEPETSTEDWNLLTVMLQKLDNNDWEWSYLHTHPGTTNCNRKNSQKCLPMIVFEIYEWITSVENMSASKISTVMEVIKPPIIQMMEYMYTGSNLKKLMEDKHDKLLNAAHKCVFSGLTVFCEAQLVESIDMENVIDMLVMADRCDAKFLFGRTLEFIRENYAEFIQLEDVSLMFERLPELAFKLFIHLK